MLAVAPICFVLVTEAPGSAELAEPAQGVSTQALPSPASETSGATGAFDGILRFAAGALLGLSLVGSAGPARADVEDVVIPVDDKGKTTTLTKDWLGRVVAVVSIVNRVTWVCFWRLPFRKPP